MVSREDLLAALQTNNWKGWEALIAEGESSNDESAWTLIVGGQHFASFDQHPHVFVPQKDGTQSSAAGKFQITNTTWTDFQKLYGPTDFSPDNQRLCAAWLTFRRHALDAVLGGRLDEATRLCVDEWTSMRKWVQNPTEAARIFTAYGGALAGTAAEPVAPIPDGTSVQPALDALQPDTEKVTPMPAILAAILPSLFSAAPELIRLFGTAGGAMTERNATVAQKIADVAVQVTGAVNEQQAAQKIQDDPATAQAFRESVAQNMDQWMGLMVKLNDMSEASKAKARDFVLAYDRSAVLGKFTFLEFLSLIFVAVSATGAGYVLWAPDFSLELKGAVIAAVLIGGYNGVKEAWFGKDMGTPPVPKQ